MESQNRQDGMEKPRAPNELELRVDPIAKLNSVFRFFDRD